MLHLYIRPLMTRRAAPRQHEWPYDSLYRILYHPRIYHTMHYRNNRRNVYFFTYFSRYYSVFLFPFCCETWLVFFGKTVLLQRNLLHYSLFVYEEFAFFETFYIISPSQTMVHIPVEKSFFTCFSSLLCTLVAGLVSFFSSRFTLVLYDERISIENALLNRIFRELTVSIERMHISIRSKKSYLLTSRNYWDISHI